jgi:signal transduction histidine kinase/CheY-like chemotaxis protein
VRRLRTSLRHKLLVTMLLATGVAVLVALAAMIGYDLRAYHQSWLADVDAQGELLGRTTAAALTFDDPKTARDNLALLRFQPKVRAAAIYDKNGRLFAGYRANGEPEPPAQPAGEGLRTEAASVLLVKPIIDQGGRLGTVYVRAQYELYDRLASYAGIALLVGLLAMLVALVVSNRLQRVVTQPILDISTVARDVVQQRNYAQRATRTSDDEVGALTDAFNNMLSEIERRTRELEALNRRASELNEELERRVHERTKQLEEATDAAQKANRAKSEFLANMSHELRTPLNAVIGFGQLLKTSDPSVEQRREFANHVVAAGRHLLTLIDEILNLAQIESGKMSLSLEPVQLAGVLADCRTMIGPIAEGRGIRLDFPSELDLAAVADRTRLKQVLLNLLSNAVKYNRDNGFVSVACARSAPARIRVSVQDTGMGLQPAQVDALFEPFNRLGRELGSEEGTGIGLVVTKRLVEAMGGQIGVRSEPGVGSVFWFELAASEPAQPGLSVEHTGSAMPETPHAAQPMATVLCVEDNPANMELLRQVLGQRRDVRLLTAADGRAGLQMAFEHRPDVIVLDNNMPHLTGSQAQALLRGDPRTSAIPVIALTANAMPDAIAAGLAAGFFRYLTKPVDIQQLLAAVSDALSSRAADDAERS